MKKIFCCFALLFSLQGMAQAPQRFYTRFGGDGDDIAYSGKPTKDGQYIIAGSSSSYGSNGNTDMYLVKVDSMGFPMWQKLFGGTGNDIARSVIQLPDSGYMMAGYTNSFGAGGYDVLIVRTDKNGNKIWQNTYGGGDWDFAYDLLRGPDANFYIVGNTSSYGSGKKDGYLLKIDSLGNVIDQKFYGGAEDDELKSIITTNDNKLAVVGCTHSFNDSLGDHYFLKLEINLDTLFSRSFGNEGSSYLNDLVQASSGDFILVGAETYTDLPFTQSYRVNMNSSATQIKWEGNSYTFSGEESWKSVTKSITGSERVSTLRDFYKDGFKKQGSIFSNEPYAFYPSIVNEFGGTENEYMSSHEGTKDGGFICFGTTESFTSLLKDIFLIKLDSSISVYSSVVGYSENLIESNNIIISTSELNIKIQLKSKILPESIELFRMDGVKILTIENPNEINLLTKENFINSVVIFKFNYSKDYFITRKIMIQ